MSMSGLDLFDGFKYPGAEPAYEVRLICKKEEFEHTVIWSNNFDKALFVFNEECRRIAKLKMRGEVYHATTIQLMNGDMVEEEKIV